MEHGHKDLTLIGDRVLRYWTESGRSDILARLVSALGNFSGRATTSDLERLLYELVWIVLHAKLTKQEVVGLLKEAQLTEHLKACDLLTDLLWVIGAEVEVSERGHDGHTSREWRQLCALVKAIADEDLVSLRNLKSLLEFDLLHDADLAPEPQVQAKKMIRINTKTLYTQTKYNLLREETEGFAKVLCLLHMGVTKSQLDATRTDLMALIGFFDLDANRVLDLVLDAYEMHPRNDYFAQLLDIFKRESLPHIIGFKFQFYKREPPAVQGVTTPRSLYRLAAILLNKGLLDLDALLPHLAPSREAILKAWAANEQAMITKAGSFGQVNLAGKKDVNQPEGDDEVVVVTDKCEKESEHYQLYGLIVGLLEIGARERAFEMILWFQERGVNPLTFTPLSKELCTVVNVMIEDVYAMLSYRTLQFVSRKTHGLETASEDVAAQTSSRNSYIQRVTTLEAFVSEVFPIVEMIGPQLYHDQFLFVKLLRLVGKVADDQTKKSRTLTDKGEHDDALASKVQSLLVNTFLPAMSLQECNPSTSFYVWDLVKNLPCEERYRIYLRWFEAYDKHPELRLKEAEVIQSTRGVMRRLTADRAKLSARSLTHIAHANPLIVFRTMLRQIQSYDNLIQPVVDSFKFVTPLGMDVLSFVLVSELSRPQKSMKSDGTHVSLWLTSLANFSGSFYRKYPNVELAGLLQYLIQRLQSWASVDLIVLSELLTKMGSCLSLEDISESQLEAQAGGPHLWFEPTDPKFQNRRAIPKLRDALIKRNLALPLCILICQMRSRIENHEDRKLPHLKLLGRVFDTCQLTLSQLLQFLGGVVDPLVYRKMLPSLKTLVRDYKVQPELAMTLCRPAMRSDDPILRTAPRSVHATVGSNLSSDKAPTTEETLHGAASGEPSWYMYDAKFLADIRQALRINNQPNCKPEDPFTGLTPEVYATFWGLKLYDIHVPFQQYEAEILRLRNAVTSGANASLGASERKKLKEKTTQMIDVLTTEQKDQVAHRKRVYERLDTMKGKFFTDEPNDRQTAIDELLQKCVIPRSLMSPEDALFAAKFMERLHTFATPQMSTLQYIHKINMRVSAIVLCATEREASNFGFFMKETLGVILRWYQNGATYDDEAIHGKIGMSLDLNDDKKRLAHRQFKAAYARWHQQLELVYTTALSSGEYMQIRNSLVVLTKLIDVFPAGRGTADVILGIVETLTNEDREDIKIMAKRYFALLTKRKSSLIDDRLLRTRIVQAKAPGAVAPCNDVKKTLEPEVGHQQKIDGAEAKQLDSTIKSAPSCVESQEVESGEIVLGKSNGNSENSIKVAARMKQQDVRRDDRHHSSLSGQESLAETAIDRRSRSERQETGDRLDQPTDTYRSSEEQRGCQAYREASPGRSSSLNRHTINSHERSRSANRVTHENSPAAHRSRSGERTDAHDDMSDKARSLREHKRERGQAHRFERGGIDRNTSLPHNNRNRSQERNLRVRDGMIAREGTEPVNPRNSNPSPSRLDESQTSISLPKSERDLEPNATIRDVISEREKENGLEAGRKRARQSEQMEAALRRQLTAGKEAKAKEQQSIDQTRPATRDRTRPPLPATTMGLPSDPETARKIVSLVSSSRKRDREPGNTKSATPIANAQEGKRRRDGDSSKGNGCGDVTMGLDEKRTRRNKGGSGDGNKLNQQHPRDLMRGRQQDRHGRNTGNGDRRGTQDDRGIGGNVGVRRRDRNDNRGGRR